MSYRRLSLLKDGGRVWSQINDSKKNVGILLFWSYAEQPDTIGVITQAFRVLLFCFYFTFVIFLFQCPFGFLSDPKNKKLVCPDCRAMSCAKGANRTNNSIQNTMTTLDLDGILKFLKI